MSTFFDHLSASMKEAVAHAEGKNTFKMMIDTDTLHRKPEIAGSIQPPIDPTYRRT